MSSVRHHSRSTRRRRRGRWRARRALRAGRDQGAAAAALVALAEAAAGTENVLPRILACVEARVTLGEISDALRGVWGEHRP